MKALNIFQRDILTLRSHQWKYFLEPYVGCGLHCLYCIYGGSNEFFQKVGPRKGLLADLGDDLASLAMEQIVYVGATVDPYQPMEQDLRLTRSVLQLLLDHEMPVMILTKSPDILDDLEMLLEFNRHGKILVQFTLITLNELKSGVLEKRVASPAQRLKAAEHLRKAGIPVHFHVAPYIPGFYSGSELDDLVKAIADHGGTCIYANTLGMRYANQEVLHKAFQHLDPEIAATIDRAYPQMSGDRSGVFSPYTEHVVADMMAFRDICVSHGISFVCEFIPQFTKIDAHEFERGIFRFGLPAVYQMMEFWADKPGLQINWATFKANFLSRYPHIDDEYLTLVDGCWKSGELFENTLITPVRFQGEVLYSMGHELHIDNKKILSWV